MNLANSKFTTNSFSFQMSITLPFATEEAQTTYQTSVTTALKTVNVAAMYKSSATDTMLT